MAPWIEQAAINSPNAAASTSTSGGADHTIVHFNEEARQSLRELLDEMRFYNTTEEAETAVRQILSLGIHDGGARARKLRRLEDADERCDFCFPFDGLEFIVRRRPSSPAAVDDIKAVTVAGANAETEDEGGGGDGEVLQVIRVIRDAELGRDDDALESNSLQQAKAEAEPAPEPAPERAA